MIDDLERLVSGLSGAPTPWFTSRIVIHACHRCGGIKLFELLGDDSKLCHAPEALEREASILVVEAQELSYCIDCSDVLLLRLKC